MSLKPHPLRVSERATFPGWTSDFAHAVIIYVPKKDKIVFIRVFGQKKKGPNGKGIGPYKKPWFPEDSYERLLRYARRVHERGYAKGPGSRRRELHNHEVALCELCCPKEVTK